MFAFAIFRLLGVDVMLIMPAYVVSFPGTCGVGVSYVYMLNIVDDKTPPCATPALNWRCVDALLPNVVKTLRHLM